jgi:hypothetical protein
MIRRSERGVCQEGAVHCPRFFVRMPRHWEEEKLQLGQGPALRKDKRVCTLCD